MYNTSMNKLDPMKSGIFTSILNSSLQVIPKVDSSLFNCTEFRLPNTEYAMQSKKKAWNNSTVLKLNKYEMSYNHTASIFQV